MFWSVYIWSDFQDLRGQFVHPENIVLEITASQQDNILKNKILKPVKR